MKKIMAFSIALLLSGSLMLWASGKKDNEKTTQAPAAETENLSLEELLASYTPPLQFDKTNIVIDEGSKEFHPVTATEITLAMTVGWNLGNSLDAPGETQWGQPKTTKEMIHGLAESGIKTIRIPVSWITHTDSNYTINAVWMNRVKEIVDWAIDEDMYVILNTHHDCGATPSKLFKAKGYYPNKINFGESARYVANIWTQIATAFNNGYDEHLIFETLNEPRLRGTGNEWWFDQNNSTCQEAAKCLNQMNQLAVNAIRATGGNNEKRMIACPALQASPDSALNSAFVMPTDDEPGKLIVSVHAYSPYVFAMQSPGTKTFTPALEKELASTFKRLHDKFIVNGYGVYIGETGAVDKANLEERIKWATYFFSKARINGMSCVLWDNGAVLPEGSTDYNEKFGYYNRNTQEWLYPEIRDAIIEATK